MPTLPAGITQLLAQWRVADPDLSDALAHIPSHEALLAELHRKLSWAISSTIETHLGVAPTRAATATLATQVVAQVLPELRRVSPAILDALRPK